MHLTYDRWQEAHELYQRIVDHYGIPGPWEDSPELVLTHDPADGYGWQWYGEIGVNFAKCDGWADVVGTMIHEYWHYCQDPERTDEEAYEAEAAMVTARDLHLFLTPLAA